ncbi:MAG: tRNA lysidine(34) synthetase TilS [Anaerolineaceae bacterium]|nr:tRNA lysidine(34) synthetase TilS [Anaerolineaceae bacterium]
MKAAVFIKDFIEGFEPEPDKPIVVAVSGGADSLCLLHLLKESGLNIIPAHFDHQLREISSQQAAQLLELLADWGYQCELGAQDVGLYAKTKKMGIEEAARVCRYTFLMTLAEKHGAQAVLTAHHQDDQVETVLMHFLRGSGLNGLSGIRPVDFLKQFSEKIPLWRPMLNISKAEILTYCAERNIQALEDESNQDSRFYRNRLRHEVIPLLEEVQPAFKRIVSRNARVFELDRQVLERITDQAFALCVIKADDGKALIIDRSLWDQQDEAIQARLLTKAVNDLRPDMRDVGFEELQRARNAIEQKATRADFKGGILIQSQNEQIILSLGPYTLPRTDIPQLIRPEEQKLTVKNPLSLQNGWLLKAEMLDAKAYKKLPKELREDPLQAWLNPADLEWPLTVRPPIVGERWSPLGMVHKRQKLSDFFINQKIPHTARENWPVVCNVGSILWLAGLRISQAWRITGFESEVLHLSLIPPK